MSSKTKNPAAKNPIQEAQNTGPTPPNDKGKANSADVKHEDALLRTVQEKIGTLGLETGRVIAINSQIKNILSGENEMGDFMTSIVAKLREDPDNQKACAYADELAGSPPPKQEAQNTEATSQEDKGEHPKIRQVKASKLKTDVDPKAAEPKEPDEPGNPVGKNASREIPTGICEMDITELKTATPFCKLLPINDEVKAGIVEDMQQNGFDPSHPIEVWKEKDVIIDGHTRLQSALECGLKTVWVVYKSFADEEAAIAHALHAQRDRRNLTDPDIFHLVGQLDQLHARGGDRRSEEATSKTSTEVTGSSAERTAEQVGTSKTKIEHARAVIKSGNDELVESVKSGKMPLYKAAATVRLKKSGKKKPEMHPTVKAYTEAVALLDAAEKLLRTVSIESADSVILLRNKVQSDAQEHGNRQQDENAKVLKGKKRNATPELAGASG